MKSRLLLVFALALSVPLLFADTPAKSAPTTPAKADVKKADAKKKDAPAKIDGLVIARTDGSFLGLTLVEGKFKLSFYDKDKKLTKPDVLRAAARWPNPHGPGNNRTVLNLSSDGKYLIAPEFVRGPYSFKLFLTLIKSENGEQTETYTVDFRA